MVTCRVEEVTSLVQQQFIRRVGMHTRVKAIHMYDSTGKYEVAGAGNSSTQVHINAEVSR